jgi:hypothetical protein
MNRKNHNHYDGKMSMDTEPQINHEMYQFMRHGF